MSDAEVLTERDRQLLQSLDEEMEAAEDTDDYERAFREFRSRFEEHLAEFRAFKRNVNRRLEDLEDGAVAEEPEEDSPPLVHYANIPREEREGLLSTSELIAVTLHDEWDSIAWKLGTSSNRRIGVDTKTKAAAKYNPSRIRYRLKEKLDRDFQATEIYRGLKRLAKLSGGEERVDEGTNRVHVSGGLYEYREMTTADYDEVKRVVWRDQT